MVEVVRQRVFALFGQPCVRGTEVEECEGGGDAKNEGKHTDIHPIDVAIRDGMTQHTENIFNIRQQVEQGSEKKETPHPIPGSKE